MDQFLQFNVGQIGQVVVLLVGVGMLFQSIKSKIQEHASRLVALETELSKVTLLMTSLARQEERLIAVDQRMLVQGARIDSQAFIINGRLEAINNIVSGHTAKLDNLRNKT